MEKGNLQRWLLPSPPRRDEISEGGDDGGASELRRITLSLMRGEDLNRTQAAQFLDALLNVRASDVQIAAALAVLAVKGETAVELAGMAEAMLGRALPVQSQQERFIDTAGTGSSARKTFNVSTAAAFVIAGAGLAVAKHGARAATSRSGSADVLEALGVNTAASRATVERCLSEHGICFMFAPRFHSATARVTQVRRQLGVHTTFNLLGPLTNPARAPFRLVGVWHSSLIEKMAAALGLIGVQNAWVVHGSDGLDEVTLNGETFVAAPDRTDPNSSATRTFTVTPGDFGVSPRAIDQLCGGNSQENARLICAVLKNGEGDDLAGARDLVIVNAAAALHLAGVTANLREAAELARESIASGSAAGKLEALVRETNRDE